MRPDVAIIGGGVVGAACALELARRGASVTLLERGPELASACSARNAGLREGLHGLVLATGHAMKGVSLAPVTGRLVAELIAGETPSHDVAPFRPDRFRPLLPPR